MIFLTAFSQSILVEEYKSKRIPGQFFDEYKYLLKSIRNIYPDAIPILYLYEGKINVDELRSLNSNIIIFNWNKKYNPALGIDLNGLLTLKATLGLFDDDIIHLDTDCIIVKNFDEYINDDVDITAVTRGFVTWKDLRNDIIFAPAIYHKNRKSSVLNYIDKLFVKGFKLGTQRNDFWANVQPCVSEIFLEAGMDLSVDFNGFPSRYGETMYNGTRIKLKVVPQYILGYPIQDEKYYSETSIIHYKTHKKGNGYAEKIFNEWSNKKSGQDPVPPA